MRSKTRLTTKDLHTAEKALMRVVAKCLKVGRCVVRIQEDNWVKRRRLLKFTFGGNPARLTAPLTSKGFKTSTFAMPDETITRFTKQFRFGGQLYTAKVVVLPTFRQATVSVCTETPPEVFPL